LSEAEWFISQNGKQSGPVTIVQLRSMRAAGALQPSDLLWKEGMGDWKAAAEVFASHAKPPPPPPNLQAAQAVPSADYNEKDLKIRNGKAQLGEQVFPLQMVRDVSIKTDSIFAGLLCCGIGILLLIPGFIDLSDNHRGAGGAAKVFLPIGGVMLAIGFFNLWAVSSRFFLTVSLHSGGVVRLQSKDRGYLEKLARAIKSASMS
jgi:hypothetical protein